jgi:hypothetical protein
MFGRRHDDVYISRMRMREKRGKERKERRYAKVGRAHFFLKPPGISEFEIVKWTTHFLLDSINSKGNCPKLDTFSFSLFFFIRMVSLHPYTQVVKMHVKKRPAKIMASRK